MKKCLVLIIVLVFGVMAHAQNYETQNRIGGNLGYFVSTGEFNGGGGVILDINNGINFGLEYQRRINNNFSIGGFFDYFSTDTEDIIIFATGEITQIKLSSVIFGISAYAIYPIDNAELYATGGIGFASGNVKISELDINESDTTIVFKLGFGARFRINEIVDLGAGLEYLNNKYGKDGLDVDGSGLTVKVALGFNF